MDELPLVWRKAGEPLANPMHDDATYMYDTDLFYGAIDTDFLLGWAKREFGKGYVVRLSWRVDDDEPSQELGRTRTLAEAKELLEGYVYAWWVTPEAAYMRDKLREDLKRYELLQRTVHEVSRQYRTARQT